MSSSSSHLPTTPLPPMFLARCCSCCCRYITLPILIILAVGVMFLHFRFAYYDRKYAHLPPHNSTHVENCHPAKPLVLLATETISLSETTRMLFIARHLREKYPPSDLDIRFFHYGGAGSFRYEDILLEGARKLDCVVHELSPRWETEEQIQHLYDVDRGEVFDDFLSTEDVHERIEQELNLYAELKPALILTGFVLTARLSARIADIPHGIVIPVMIPPYDLLFETYLGRFPPLVDLAQRYFPQKLANRILFWFVHRIWYLSTQFRNLALEYGIRPVHDNILSLMVGQDYTLVTDVPVMAGMESDAELQGIFGETFRFVGPMFAKLEMEIPAAVASRIQEVKNNSQNNKKVLYFAMGSSGQQKHVENILHALDRAFKAGKLEEIGLVVSPTKRLLYKFEGDIERHREFVEQIMDDRILLTEILPAPEVNALCDLGIIHGGQGTVQTAVSSGMPFVGVPAQFEQTNNIKMVVLASSKKRTEGLEGLGGFPAAIYVEKGAVLESGDPVVEAVEDMLSHYDDFRSSMGELKSAFAEYDVGEIVEDILVDLLGWRNHEK